MFYALKFYYIYRRILFRPLGIVVAVYIEAAVPKDEVFNLARNLRVHIPCRVDFAAVGVIDADDGWPVRVVVAYSETIVNLSVAHAACLGEPCVEREYYLAEDVIGTEFNLRPLLERRNAELGGDVAVSGINGFFFSVCSLVFGADCELVFSSIMFEG